MNSKTSYEDKAVQDSAKICRFRDPLLGHLEDLAKDLDLSKIEPKDTLGISKV